jgi:hypothetical protein
MLIAASYETKNGRKLLVVGLSKTNIDGLVNDEPILKRLDGKPDELGETEGVQIEGLEEWDLVIMGPEDTPRFIAATRPDQLEEFLASWV